MVTKHRRHIVSPCPSVDLIQSCCIGLFCQLGNPLFVDCVKRRPWAAEFDVRLEVDTTLVIFAGGDLIALSDTPTFGSALVWIINPDDGLIVAVATARRIGGG